MSGLRTTKPGDKQITLSKYRINTDGQFSFSLQNRLLYNHLFPSIQNLKLKLRKDLP